MASLRTDARLGRCNAVCGGVPLYTSTGPGTIFPAGAPSSEPWVHVHKGGGREVFCGTTDFIH
jgi:hypothetical protein